MALSASAAELWLEWDVAASWDGEEGVINTGYIPSRQPDQQGESMLLRDGSAYVPGDGSIMGTGGLGAGPLSRPYLDLPLGTYSYLQGASNAFQSSLFEHADRTGYSIVGYFYFSSAMTIQHNAGIGTAHGVSGQSEFLYSNEGGANFQSWTQMILKEKPDGWSDDDCRFRQTDDIDMPRDQWIQFTKVFNAVTGEILYYINDNPVPLLSSLFDANGDGISDVADYKFESRGDQFGWFGTGNPRRLEGMSVSYFAVYDGVLSTEEIAASYAMLTVSVPEPATMTLLAFGGLAILRRRRSRRGHGKGR